MLSTAELLPLRLLNLEVWCCCDVQIEVESQEFIRHGKLVQRVSMLPIELIWTVEPEFKFVLSEWSRSSPPKKHLNLGTEGHSRAE